MENRMAKKLTKKRAKTQGTRRKRFIRAAPPPVTQSAAVAPTVATVIVDAPIVKPARARMSRRTLTPAQRRGLDLARFLRIHARKPYGRRGEEAIRRLAVEVGHLGNLELNASSAEATT
jgi:hypothetical protein